MQNQETIEQIIRKHENEMPPEIMALIKAFDWKKEVRTIVNQNQLMIDVGADLEQSIYLMILGVVSVGDLYERLVEVYEIPDDKCRKIIQEIEDLIFNPLQQKLISIDGVEDEDQKEEKPNPVLETKQDSHRDAILAEIEKEPEPLIKLNFGAKTEEIKPTPVAAVAGQAQVKPDTVVDSGIVKPFTIMPVKETEKPLSTQEIKPVVGVQADPISTGLKTPTITQVNTQTTDTQKTYVADPYREPIE